MKKSNPTNGRLALAFLVLLILQTSAFAQNGATVPPMPPRSGVEPPAAAKAESLAASTAAAPGDLLIHFEKTNGLETGRYAEAVDFLRKLEKRSPYIKVTSFGTTPEGRDMVVAIISKDRAFTPQLAAKTGKPVVLIQNGIHAGEIGGKDASLMLARDILVSKKFAGWLDKMTLLVMPVFNIDGHERFSAYNRVNQNGPKEMGFRVTGQRFNLNRDYIKADSPEMRAWLKLYTAWLPEFFFDNHVTDGQDQQYDVTISTMNDESAWPSVVNWTKQKYLPELAKRQAAGGHVLGPYLNFRDPRDIAKGVEEDGNQPRFSNGYAPTQNRIALLVETHSLKLYKTQVWSHYDIMVDSLDIIAAEATSLKQAVTDADTAVASLFAQQKPLSLDQALTNEGVPFTFRSVGAHYEKSIVTGGDVIVYEPRVVDISTTFFNRVKSTVEKTVPYAYFIPRQWQPAVELLKLHGVTVETLKKPVTVEIEGYRFSNPKWSERPFEGRHMMTFQTTAFREVRTYPAGTAYVPMNQRAARVALNILEPDAPDSMVHWGFFDNIFEQKEYVSGYVFEPIAREMLARDPKLKEEFEAKLAADPKFAANPRERLDFLYRRSPYFENDKDVYPIVRVLAPIKD